MSNLNNTRQGLMVEYNQNRSATYAKFARTYRDDYVLGTWFGRHLYKKEWVLDKISEFQILSQAHAQMARIISTGEDFV